MVVSSLRRVVLVTLVNPDMQVRLKIALHIMHSYTRVPLCY